MTQLNNVTPAVITNAAHAAKVIKDAQVIMESDVAKDAKVAQAPTEAQELVVTSKTEVTEETIAFNELNATKESNETNDAKVIDASSPANDIKVSDGSHETSDIQSSNAGNAGHDMTSVAINVANDITASNADRVSNSDIASHADKASNANPASDTNQSSDINQSDTTKAGAATRTKQSSKVAKTDLEREPVKLSEVLQKSALTESKAAKNQAVTGAVEVLATLDADSAQQGEASAQQDEDLTQPEQGILEGNANSEHSHVASDLVAPMMYDAYQKYVPLTKHNVLNIDKYIIQDIEDQAPCIDLHLTYNYRSQANILAASFDVISHNHDVIRRPLLAKREDIELSQMIPVKDPNVNLVKETESKLQMLETIERLGALSHIGSWRQHVVESLDVKMVTSSIEDLRKKEQEKLKEPVTVHTMKPVIVHVPNISVEAQFVTYTIMDIQRQDPEASIAILYRNHSVGTPIEEEFMRCNIRYRVVGSVRFFERKEIQDALAYMHLRINPDNDIALRRVINVPPRRFGAKRMELLESLARKDRCSLFQALLRYSDLPALYQRNQVGDFVQAILELNDQPLCDAATDFELVLSRCGYEEWLKIQGEDERLDNLAILKKNVVDFVDNQGEDVNLADFLYSVMLLTDADDINTSRKEVQMMTIHTAKGLEFDYVFLVGVNENIFPSRQAITSNNLEEERRLMYVAMTRARKQLIMSEAGGVIYFHAPSTMSHNQDHSLAMERKPSRFLNEITDAHRVEIGAELIQKREEDKAKANVNQSADSKPENYKTEGQEGKLGSAAEQLNAQAARGFKFDVGNIVKHRIFGEGRIDRCNSEEAVYEIYFFGLKRTRNLTAVVANRSLELISLGDSER